MNLWIGIEAFVAALIGAMGGSAAVLKLLGNRWLEKVKAKYSIELADRQNAFSMGASSHMALVVFDKLIGFCEEYVEAISKPLYALIQEGKKDQPLDTIERTLQNPAEMGLMAK
jgi:hypothetical protein